MSKTKKLITLLLALCMIFALTACGGSETPAPAATPKSRFSFFGN